MRQHSSMQCTQHQIKRWLSACMKKDSSSPGIDGFGPSFYPATWDITSPFRARSVDLERVNRFFIVLLPKKKDSAIGRPVGFSPSCQNCFFGLRGSNPSFLPWLEGVQNWVCAPYIGLVWMYYSYTLVGGVKLGLCAIYTGCLNTL